MKKGIKVIYVFFITLCILLTGCMQKSVKITFNPKKGDSYKLEIDKNETVVYSINGEKKEVESKVKTSYLCHITNIDDNKNSEIKVVFDNINIKNSIPSDQTLVMDFPNNAKNTDKLSKIHSVLEGKSFNVKIGEFGKVKQISGIDEIAKNVLQELNINDKEKEKEIKDIIKNNFGEEELMKAIERITYFYPNKAVKVGDSWNHEIDLSGNFQIESENEYKLRNSQDGTSEIKIKGDIKNKNEADPIIIGDAKITYEDMKGIESGTISLNEENGLIKREEIENVYSGKIKYSSDNPNMGSHSFPVSVNEKITVNVLRQ